jgi:hypothetical protein
LQPVALLGGQVVASTLTDGADALTVVPARGDFSRSRGARRAGSGQHFVPSADSQRFLI